MKIKKLIPALCAFLMVFALVTPTVAAEGNTVEVKSGSTSAKVTFTVEDVLAFEGTVSTKKTNGFKVQSIEVSGLADGSLVDKSPEGDQVVVIGKNIPATIKLTVTLESSSPMKDGSYAVTLNYGVTNYNGAYLANKRATAMIYVGIKPDDSSANSQNKSELAAPPSSTEEETDLLETPIVQEEGEAPDRVGVLGLLDVSRLRSALADANLLLEAGDLNAEEKSMLRGAIDQGEEAMEGDLQYKVDEAADLLYTVIEELGGPIEDTPEEEEPSGGGGFPWIIIIVVIVVLAILAALYLGYRYKKKKNNRNYDGAPMIDYEIGDDDQA